MKKTVSLTPSYIPISLYIHLPWCVKKCPYCDFSSFEDPTFSPAAYLETCMAELNKLKVWLQGRKIQTIFIGGGTPNLFSPKQIACLLDQIINIVPVKQTAEISMEANPGVNQHSFKDYQTAGVNRISLGVQSFQHKFLEKIQRIHREKEIFNSIEGIKKAAFNNFNLDLMFGLPEQTIKEALYDVEKAIAQQPTHLSWYQLTIEKDTPFAEAPPTLPNDELIWEMQQAGEALLRANGFEQYEVSAYAKKDFECQHNLNYWQFGDYLGIGTGAHSKLTDFKTQQIFRIEKICSTELQPVQQKNLPLEFMLNALRLRKPFSLNLFEERTGLPLSMIQTSLEKAEQENFLIIKNNRLYLTNKGKTFTNQLLTLF